MPGGLSITAYPINRDSYSPEIYVGASYGEAVQRITVQTTSWGALPVSEIDKVIGAYTESQMVAREIYLAFPECFKEVPHLHPGSPGGCLSEAQRVHDQPLLKGRSR